MKNNENNENNEDSRRQKIKAYAPLLAAVLVVICAAISLSGYEPPVYAAADAAQTEETDTDTQEEADEAEGLFDLADGIYEGTGTGFAGQIRVAVEIKDKRIVAITILSSSDDATFFEKAKAVIERIIGAQSLDVDTVSGATYSSKGIISAVKNALTGESDDGQTAASQSSGSSALETMDDADSYKDGTYYGTGQGFSGTVKVKVVVKNSKISSISVVSHSDGSSYMSKAKKLIKKIISGQTTNVDTISGATYSSKGIIRAVRNALKQATTKSSSKSKKTTTTTTQTTGSFPYKDGIYYGSAQGYSGTVKVAVVLQDQTIKAILVQSYQDDDSFFSRAKAVLTSIVSSQSTSVDVVSGATRSSNGLINAVKNALKEAETATNGGSSFGVDTAALTAAISSAEALNESDYTAVTWAVLKVRLQDAKDAKSYDDQDRIDKATENLNSAIRALEKADGSSEGTVYNNGTYTVSTTCYPDEDEDFDEYTLTAKIQIKNDKIVSIENVSGDGGSDNQYYINRAVNGMRSKILEKGTAEDVDTKSGATCSSKALKELCKLAFEAAKK